MRSQHMLGLLPPVPLAEQQGVESSTTPTIITNITVTKLFGRYSYSIPDPETHESSRGDSRLLLLYGDNGSGKTTILRLVYHLLSSAEQRNHRTFIAQTPFEQLIVTFANRTRIAISRPAGQLRGSFVATIEDRDEGLLQFRFEANDDLVISSKAPPDQLAMHARFSSELARLNLRPYFLSDDRSIVSDTLNDAEEQRYIFTVSQTFQYASLPTYGPSLHEESLPREVRQGRELQGVIRRTEDWLRQQAFRGTDMGSVNANSLYLEVLRHIATATGSARGEIIAVEEKSIEERLAELDQRTAAFAEFGLGTALPATEFLAILSEAPQDRRDLVSEVLEPYLDGVQARLDALSDTQELLVTFTSAMNSFLANKVLRFNVLEGISISSIDGERLPPAALSSGERQLLLLLCSVLAARDESRLFIIDEPEISLNVKWQRRLLDTLLKFTAGTSMQFLVATHSIEMVAGHFDSVAKLVDERARQSQE